MKARKRSGTGPRKARKALCREPGIAGVLTTGQACADRRCSGAIVDTVNLIVERCTACNVFRSDDEAAEHVANMLAKVGACMNYPMLQVMLFDTLWTGELCLRKDEREARDAAGLRPWPTERKRRR